MSPTPWSMRCSACGTAVTDPLVMRCPVAGKVDDAGNADDADHVLVPDEPSAPWPTELFVADDVISPFVRYRHLLASYRSARSLGLSDADYVDLVHDLDAAVSDVDGRGFRITPLTTQPALATALGHDGMLVVKDETNNVSGSHKGRHLVGIMHHLLAIEATGGFSRRPRLAIASCGNAALAATVVARAAAWPIDVFVPPDASPAVLGRLDELGATVRPCERRADESGDPCFLRFTEATVDGSLPFSCQGPANGLTIDGGTTLGLEYADQLAALARSGDASTDLGASSRPCLDHLVLQVGGGAFATATMLGLRRALDRSVIDRLPRLHAVQTTGAAPLARAADLILGSKDPRSALDDATRRRSGVMWPWEDEPQSLASGILDDETYDWRTIVRDLVDTGGTTPVVAEDSLVAAFDAVASTTSIRADHTGISGLAGVVELLRDGVIEPDDRIGVIASGARRD